MQAVILAAGKGTRMKELTKDTPKPMLLIGGRPVLEHEFDTMPDEVDEIILIVGYLKEVIQNHFGDSYRDKKIRYIEQKELNGTAGALWLAKPYLTGRFVVLNGDDLYAKEDVAKCLESPWSDLVWKVDTPSSGAKVILNEQGDVVDIVESGPEGNVGLINAAMYGLDTRIFDFSLIPKAPGSPEFGLPQTLLAASKQAGITVHAVEAHSWIQITAPEDLKKAEEALKANRK